MRHFLPSYAGLAIFLGSAAAYSQTQEVVISAESTQLSPDSQFLATVSYQATDDALTTGLGLRLHFDSSKLTFNSLADVLANDKISEQSPVEDSSDFDNDPSTDRFVLVSWASFNGSWPTVAAQPAKLFDVSFNASSTFDSSTTLNLSASSTASGFSLDPQSLTLTKVLGADSELSDILISANSTPVDLSRGEKDNSFVTQMRFPTNEVSFDPILVDSNATKTVRINGQEDNDGILSLEKGLNIVGLVIAAENGIDTTTYSFDIERLPALAVDVAYCEDNSWQSDASWLF